MGIFEGAFLAIIGFLQAILVFGMSMLGGISGGSEHSSGLLMGFGVLALIIIPIIYLILGFITGAVGAIIYNIVAAVSGGGVEIDISEK